MMKGKLLTAAESSPPTYVPGRAAEAIRVQDLLLTIRRAGHNAEQNSDRIPREDTISQLIGHLEDERSKALDSMTLRDLVNDTADLTEQS
jgi:DNA-binding IscR family transcriptional regulator